MAEVKRAASGSSFSHSSSKKKPPSFSNNGVSSSSTSFKHIYDDVFASSSPSKVKSSACFMEDDYAEVFGSSKSNNGAWSISYSSVPILDLPKEKEKGFGSRAGGGGAESFDYGGVFGDNNSHSFGLLDGEELFDQLKKKPKTSSAAHILPSFKSQGQTTEATNPEISGQSYDGQSLTNGFYQSFDSMKQFEPENKVVVNTSRGPRKAAHARAYSLHEVSATQKTLSSQTPVIEYDMVDTESKQGKHARHTSLDLGAIKQNNVSDSSLQKVSGMSGSVSVDISHGTATNGFCESVDNTKLSGNKINGLSFNSTITATHSTNVHPIQESNHSLKPEARPESLLSNELGPTQKTSSSTTSVLSQETQPSIGVVSAKKQSSHSRKTSLDPGASTQNGQSDPLFQKASGLSESTSIDDASHEPCQAAGPSKVVTDDAEIAIGCDKIKKKDRRSRMTSIDLGDYKPSRERDEGQKRKPRFGGSYSFDASHDPSASQVKAQPSMMYPSSSLPRFFPVESHYKVSENSSSKSSQKNPYRSAGGFIPPLAEELDLNSAAAVSVAVLQRAIEEAEMRIRLAKAFLERECHGSTNLRFKDTLKVKVSKKRTLANEVNNFKQTEMHHYSPIVDSDMQTCSPLERKSVVENAQAHRFCEEQAPPDCEAFVPPVFEDQKNSVMDGELTKNGARESNLVGEDGKHEGEWEAAKHINQLLSGVKSRLASFMSWQTETDTEKKEDVKDMEANIEFQQQPEEVENTFEDYEASKQNRLEGNHGITSAGRMMNGANTVQFASEASVAEENESMKRFIVKQNKAGNTVDFIPDTAGSSSENFQFYAFRNQILCDPPDPKVEEAALQEIRESEMENGQEQVINEVKNEHRTWHSEERLEPDDECVAHDPERQDDVYRMNNLDPSDEKIDNTLKESCYLGEYNDLELSHEEERQGLMDRNIDTCSVNEEKVEMVEDHCSIGAYDEKEPTHEEDWQDDTSSKDYTESCDEEFHEILEEPYTIVEQEDKGLTHDVDGEGDLYKKVHLGVINEEINDSVKELCTLAEHERNNAIHEVGNDISPSEEFREDLTCNSHQCENILEKNDNDNDNDSECEVLKEIKKQHENVEIAEEFNLVGESWKNDRDQQEINHIEDVSRQNNGWEDIKLNLSETDHIEPIMETAGGTLQSSFVVSTEGEHKQKESEISSEAEACSFVIGSTKFEEAVYIDEEIEMKTEMSNSSSDLELDLENPIPVQTESGLIGEWPPVSGQTVKELIVEEPVLSSVSTEINMEHDKNVIKDQNSTIGIIPHVNLVSSDSKSDMSLEQKDVDVEAESQDNLKNQTDLLHEPGDNLHVGEFDTGSDQDAERSGAEVGHRRRRWFDNSRIIGTADRPSILQGNRTDLETDQEILDETELAGSVEVHADELDCRVAELKTDKDADVPSNQDSVKNSVETTPTRRKWFVKRGEQGVPEPLSLFEGIKVNLEVPLSSANETVMHNIADDSLDKKTKCEESLNGVKSDVAINGEQGKQNGEAAPRRRRWFEGSERVGVGQQLRINEDVGLTVEMEQESNVKDCAEQHGKLSGMSISQEKGDVHNKVESVKEHLSDQDDLNRKEKAREKEKVAVERAIREARERAFAEARERARKDAAERPNVEARHKVAAGIQEKLGKVSSEATSSLDKASVEAKLKAERAAVERATAEARERALQKALSEKISHRSREQAGRYSSEKNSSLEPKCNSSRSSDSSNNSEKFDVADVESTQRRKARLERQKRTMERATNALEEKNRRDILAQKEQAAKNILADSLDSEVKRWSTGKEGNLRALLSTLQYILGPDSGWQPVSLTDLVAATAVRKSYKKATLCVHPDKLQQRSASIQQKYICEKVFDLLKEAWSKFNPDER